MSDLENEMIAFYAGLKSAPFERPPPPLEVAPKGKELTKREKLALAFRRHEKPCALDMMLELAPPEKPTLQSILTEVSIKYNVSEHALKSKCRVKRVSHPRQEFYYRATAETLRSYPEIGRWIGGRDHTTVMYGVMAHCLREGLDHPRDPGQVASVVIQRKSDQQRKYKAALVELRAQEARA